MPEYRFDHVQPLAFGTEIVVHGKVTIEHPRATVKVDVFVPAFSPRTFNLTIDPKHLKAEDTQHFAVAVTISLEAQLKKKLIVVVVKVAGAVAYTNRWNFDKDKNTHTIRAYGIPIFIPKLGEYADHTYAIATHDKTGEEIIWKCGGSYQAGRELLNGEGDALPCDCISERGQVDPAGLGGLAGIRYAVDGVCHQATNRILYPVGLEVKGAHAYDVSFYLYGRLGTFASDGYGKKYWDSLRSRCTLPQAPVGAAAACEAAPPLRPADILAEQTSTTLFDLEQATDAALTKTQTDGLMEELGTAIAVRERLSAALLEGSIGGEDLAAGINAAAATYMATASRIVPQGMFGRVFGVEPGEKVLLVNPLIAAQVYKSGVPEQFKSGG